MRKCDLLEGFMGTNELGWAAFLSLAPCLQVWLDQTEVAYFLVSFILWYTIVMMEETQQSKQKQDDSSDLRSSWGGGVILHGHWYSSIREMEMTEKHNCASIYHSAGLRAWVKKTHNA